MKIPALFLILLLAKVVYCREINVQKKDQYTDRVSSGGLIDVGAKIKSLKSGEFNYLT